MGMTHAWHKSAHTVKWLIGLMLGAALALTVGLPTASASPNAAMNKPYTSSVPAADNYPDSGRTELTDGVFGSTTSYRGPEWQGRLVTGFYNQTIDLGSKHEIEALSANFYENAFDGIRFPKSVSYAVSTDSVHFTPIGAATPQSQINKTKKYVLALDAPIQARYVRMTVHISDNRWWIFQDEIEVFQPAATQPKPQVAGSFIEADYADTLSDSDLKAEFAHMKAAGLHQLVLNWTANSKNRTTIYPSSLPGYTQTTTHDVVNSLLNNASDAGIEVYVGLQANNDWWIKYAGDPSWLDDQARIAIDLADDLWSKYGGHPSFRGWYIYFEVDNWNLPTAAEWDNLSAFYKTIHNHIHTRYPDTPIIIAPFFNPKGGLDPKEWQKMWEYILERVPLDIIAIQDGIGAGNVTVEQLPNWFRAVKNAINNKRPSAKLWADSENFTPEGRSMGIKFWVDSLNAVRPYVSNYLSFTYNHYTSPLKVPAIYNDTYLDYLENGAVESSAPTVPGNLAATALDAQSIGLIWKASTDNFGVAGYKIYRNNELVWKIYSGDAVTYTDKQLNSGTSYSYRIKSFDAAGNESALSTPVSAATLAGPNHPTNLALGAPYTASTPASSAYPDSGGELTDGKYGKANYGDAAWQGRLGHDPYFFVVDLGAVHTIREVSSNWLQDKKPFIWLPDSVSYYISNDNVNFTLLGKVDKPAVSDSLLKKKYRLLDLSSSGRYVKVVAASASFSFIDEIEVRQ